MAFEDHYDSTKALGVYNALRMMSHGREVGFAVSAGSLRDFLAEHWTEEIDELYVATGIAFLLDRGFVALTNDGVTLTRPGARLKRTDQNRELAWA